MIARLTLLTSASILFHSFASAAQQAEPSAVGQPAGEPGDEEDEEIVITGQRPAGSVVGDIPPQNVLDSRDLRATGAASIAELLDALAPQIGSAQGRGGGGPPVLLLGGRRISGFRELRDIPVEAIQRVEVLPEEVALKYGYRADQKVVNIVLRERFRSTSALASANSATDGGYWGATGDITRLLIGSGGRTTFNLRAEANGMLTEAERDIAAGSDGAAALAARALLPSKQLVRGTATINRALPSGVSATFNGELQHNRGRSLIGLGQALLEPLARETVGDSVHAGVALNGDAAGWRWSLTGNADYGRDRSSSDRDSADRRDRAEEERTSGDLRATASGTLFALPAGNASTTLTVAGETRRLDGESRRAGVRTASSLGRAIGRAAANLDLPLSRRNRGFAALGNLTLNANAEVERLSDFGTLTTFGGGANWSPLERVNLLASWAEEQGAPTIQQLGSPVIETPDSRLFDFTAGETVLVTAITGGNPDLRADRRRVLKFGANWQPLANADLRLRGEFVRQRIDRPISAISASPAVEQAFPGRFARDPSGRLLSVDLRPVNFDSSRQETLRIGLDFSKPLRSRRPSQSVIDRIRAEVGGRLPARPPGESRPPSDGPPPEDRRAGGRGFGGGGFFVGGSRGRLQFSITDTITFVDTVRIAPGIGLDYLHGDSAGSLGGTPRHRVQAQAGWSNNGLGARLAANWRSGTRVETLGGDALRFSPLGTVDLRLFANLGEMPELVLDRPWLRGTQVRLEANNLFNSRPKVRNSAGGVPLNYQPDLLDPLGRTVMISIRKLFLPPRGAFRRMREAEGRARR